jgi:hypothetical protein
MNGTNKDFVVVPLIWPISQDGALVSDIISLKNYDQADIYIQIGTVTKAGAVTLSQGVSVASCATSLSFANYWSTGLILEYDGASGETPAAAGETATGAGGGVAYVYKDLGNKLVCYAHNGTAFVDNEVLTFSGGKTAVVNGTLKNEDILVPRTATSNTFDCSAVASKQYVIPVNGSMLTDGLDCIKVSIADMDTTGVVAFAVLSKPRYVGEPPETSIYN